MVSFTPWERIQFLYIEREMGKKLKEEEKILIALYFYRT
jgi:hypothetical protein